MNVLIKGLEIPEEGAIRVVIQKHCGIAVAYTGEDPYQRAHEVVELPEKHGRLIDADALIAKRGDLAVDSENIVELSPGWTIPLESVIDIEPTIVEAEGKEEGEK